MNWLKDPFGMDNVAKQYEEMREFVDEISAKHKELQGDYNTLMGERNELAAKLEEINSEQATITALRKKLADVEWHRMCLLILVAAIVSWWMALK